MWLSRAVLLLAVLALGPTGCGFRPLYGKQASGAPIEVSDDLAAIRVQSIDDRLGQQLRTMLAQRLSPAGEPARPRYDLMVKLTTSLEGLDQQKDAHSTLGRMTMHATFVLVQSGTPEDGPNIFSGASRSIVSFSYLGARYASVAMERDAEERAAEELAENIRRQLAVRFAKSREGGQR